MVLLLRFSLLICYKLGAYGFNVIPYKNDILRYEFLMPNEYPDKNNICASVEIRDNFYLVGFELAGSKKGPHEMLLHGCSKPGSIHTVWNCGERLKPCLTGDQIIYAWSGDSPSFTLPKRVGFNVGGNSSIQHLVLQVQYLHRSENENYGDLGLYINYTKQQMPLQAGVILLDTENGMIPPYKNKLVENACTLLENKVIHPFAFRTHTHDLSVKIAGYVVRQGVTGDDWTMIGKRNPQLREMFSPVADNGPVQPGDVVATRCTMHNPNSYAVYIGKTQWHEKCQFYLMYWVDNDTPLKRKYCVSTGPPFYYWSRAIENFKRSLSKIEHIKNT